MSRAFTLDQAPRRARTIAFAVVGIAVLAGCEDGNSFNIRDVFAPRATAEEPAAAPAGEVIERDVEAPEVFDAQEAGLWDGRPSLGGVWVAHPDVTEPERVLIENQTNGQTVVGALFRRERDIPGPRLQISSDAAAAIGVLAGAPVELSVVALRKETIEVSPPAPELDEAIAEAPSVEETPLDPIAAASAAIDTAPAEQSATIPAAEVATAAAATAPSAPTAPAPVRASSSPLAKPFIQIGIFSVEANARRTADQMRAAGLIPTVLAQESAGKPFWRVIVGPATSSSERRQLLNTIKGVGFSDAYAVTN